MKTQESAPAAPVWGAVVSPSESLAAGEVLGSYRIVELLGVGGMGHVYVAEHLRLRRRVALKVLRDQFNTNDVAIARFFAEARAVNKISHENIVEITDFVENDGGKNYYIMELLKGEDLGRFLARMRFAPVLRAVDIAAQIAAALTAVHAGHIIHRDLKPDNIFLVQHASRPGFVKLLDFGVAKLCDPDGEGIQIGTTAVGTIVGTPEYMSPEQASCDLVDHRTDIYALGVVLYQMITGETPFRGRGFRELVVKHLTEEPKRPSEHPGAPNQVPPALDDLIIEMLAKDASKRPQQMSEVEQRLRAIQDALVPSAAASSASARLEAVLRSGEYLVVRPQSEPAPDPAREPTLPAVLPEASKVQVAIGARKRRWWLAAVPVALAAWIAMRDHAPRTEAAETSEPSEPITAPAAAVAQPNATEVLVRFRSSPPGAIVRVAGSELVLGTTPFAREFPRGKPLEVQFDLPGHAPITQHVAPANDAEVTAILAPLPIAAQPAPPPVKRRARAPKKVSRDGIFNVFDN